MSAAAGIVVTEMNTPMSAFARDSVSETTPTTPASTATITENTFGELMRSETGRIARPVELRGLAGPPDEQPEDQCRDNRYREPRRQGGQAPPDSAAVFFVDAERGRHDGGVLRAYHHRRDDEDLRVGEYAHRADQAGDDQQPEEAERVLAARADVGLDHLPHRRKLAEARSPACLLVSPSSWISWISRSRDLRVDRAG